MPTVNQLVRKGRKAPTTRAKTPALRGAPHAGLDSEVEACAGEQGGQAQSARDGGGRDVFAAGAGRAAPANRPFSASGVILIATIDDLLSKVDSKYTLVHLSARRAREINAYYTQLGEGLQQFVPPLVSTGFASARYPVVVKPGAQAWTDVGGGG